MIVAGGKNWTERISGYDWEGDGDDSRWDLDERKIEFVDGGEGNSNGVRREEERGLISFRNGNFGRREREGGRDARGGRGW